MAIILKNKLLKLKIETPAEKYRGSRFDWNGTITQVWYKGKKMLSQEKKLFSRDDRIYGRGLHNEFGIKNCIGYDEIPESEYFPKLGTGWLKKDDKPYFFYTQYKLDALEFSFNKISDTKAIFMCDSGVRNGYGYRYTKTIELTESSFEISYELENVGEKKIETTEYVHNFILPNNKKVNNHLELFFNWTYDKENLSENVKTQNLIDFTENGIKFFGEPKEEFFVGGVYEARKEKDFTSCGTWTLKDTKNNITMKEIDSFVPYHCDIWGHDECISPELFIWLSVAPQEKTCWTRKYLFE